MDKPKIETIKPELFVNESIIYPPMVALITNAIDKNIELPPDAKKAIKDFISEAFNELWDTLEELTRINPPLELAEYWDTVIQIILPLI